MRAGIAALVLFSAALAGGSAARVSAAPIACPGDCDGDGTVAIDELLTGVVEALGGTPSNPCTAFDRSGDGIVTIDELVAAVTDALDGCPPIEVSFSATLDPDGPALELTPLDALLPETIYALVLTGDVTDPLGRPLQPSDAFRALKGSDEQPVAGPVAQFETDLEAPDNPYPDGRLVDGNQVHIPDRFALRGLADTPALAPARTLLRTTADAVGAAGLFSTTAPIRIALSGSLELATVNPNSVRLFARSDDSLELAPLLQQLQRRGIQPSKVALAISFPTTAVEDDLLAVRARLDERAASGSLHVVLTDRDPTDDLVIGVFPRGAPEFADFFAANPDVGTVVHGLVPSPDFRGADNLFDPAKVSGTVAAEDAMLDFYLTLPATPGPHRVVVVQHGFGGDNSFGLTVANELAQQGLAGIAIDAVDHGRRGNPLDLLSPNPLQLRDALRQTNADQLALVRAVQLGIDVNGDGVSELDPTELGYLGESLGGIVGGTFIALEPSVHMAVLNVAGGRVAFLGNNPGVRPIYTSFLASDVQLDLQDPRFEVFIQRILELGQQGLDSADPLDYARHWRRDPFPGFAPRRVLMQEGIGDQLVSNESTEELAAAGGLAAQHAMSDPGGVSGLWRFDPPGGHGIFSRPDVREQAFRYLGSGGTVILAEGCRTSDQCLAGVDHCVAPADADGTATQCTGDGDCPAHFICPPGDGTRSCARQSCAADTDCGVGDCVNGGCYDSLGSCVGNAP